MNIVIHHSWKDKTIAELLANDIKPLRHHTVLSSRNRKSHDAGIVLLIWTTHAANSDEIADKLAFFTENKNQITVCLFDATDPPATIPAQECIDFHPYQEGFARLVRVISPSDPETIRVPARPVDRAAEYKMMSRQKLQMQLFQIIQQQSAESDQQLNQRFWLEQQLNTLTCVDEQTDPSNSELAFRPTPGHIAAAIAAPAQQRQELHHALAQCVTASFLSDIVDDMQYYLQCSADVLGLLYDITFNTRCPITREITELLFDYANNRKQSAEFNEHNIMAIIDIAWLIHNTAYRLIEAGLLSVTLLPFNWQRIASADDVALHYIPQTILNRLEALLLLFMRMMALKARHYQPSFHNDDADYHPYMGYAAALGLELVLPDVTRSDWVRY